MDSLRILNTAIIKTKESHIDINYEQRLQKISQSPAIEHLSQAIIRLSDAEGVSRDQAATMIIELMKSLDNIWEDYIKMEGIDKLKTLLSENSRPS